MFNISQTNKKVILTNICLGLIAFGVGCFFTENILAYFLGLLLGVGFSCLKMILLENTLNKSVDMSSKQAENFAKAHYTLRYFLTMVVLLVGALVENVSLYGVIIGLVILRPAIYITQITDKKGE